MAENEFEERSRLIEMMLDNIMPIKEDWSDDRKDAVDTERQALVMRAGWGDMPLEELRQRATGGQ